MLPPSPGDSLGPFEHSDEADCPGVFECERSGEMEDTDGGNGEAGDVWWVVGGEDNERLS